MKKLFLCTILAGASLYAIAQTADMAVSIANQQYEGTARTIAMGNAFTSLGGDLGAISLNPAGSAVLRHTELSITPSLNIASANTNYLGTDIRSSATRFSISNAGASWNFDTNAYSGLLNFSIGVIYNSRSNFNSGMSASGATDQSTMLSSIAENLSHYGIPYYDLEKSDGYNPYNNSLLQWSEILAWNTYLLATVDPETDNEYISSTENIEGNLIYIPDDVYQQFNRRRVGGVNEVAINFGANISDKLYLGLNANFLSVNSYVEESYMESAYNPSAFQDGFVKMNHNYWQRTAGAGFDLKFGVIYTPFDGLRLAGTISTPSWYRLTDTWGNTMESEFNNGNRYTQYSPTGTYSYKMTAPFRFSLGASYIFGERGLISFDYENVNYGATKMSPWGTSISSEIDYQNALLKNYASANIFRAGAEFWIIPSLAIRGGFSSYGATFKGFNATNLVSGGIGFKISYNSSIDLAYQHKLSETDTFSLYTYENPACPLSAPEGTTKQSGSRIYLTYSFKF